MPDELKFSKEAYDQGQAAFLRGIALDRLVEQINRETRDPNADKDGSDEQFKTWCAEQDAREAFGVGLFLGYANGVLQAIRRIDNQLMQSQQ